MPTLFERIIAGELPATVVFRDARVIAFLDIRPAAPVHILIVPHKAIPTTDDIADDDESLIGHMVIVARDLARQHGIARSGYRLIINCNPDSGQEVYHLHMHLLGGQAARVPWSSAHRIKYTEEQAMKKKKAAPRKAARTQPRLARTAASKRTALKKPLAHARTPRIGQRGKTGGAPRGIVASGRKDLCGRGAARTVPGDRAVPPGLSARIGRP